jgi:hypothetical protein
MQRPPGDEFPADFVADRRGNPFDHRTGCYACLMPSQTLAGVAGSRDPGVGHRGTTTGVVRLRRALPGRYIHPPQRSSTTWGRGHPP